MLQERSHSPTREKPTPCCGQRSPGSDRNSLPLRRRQNQPLPRRSSLQNDPLIAHAAGDVLAVEVLQERNGIFARDAGEVLELGDVDLLRLGFLFGKRAAQPLQRLLVKNQVVAQLDQGFLAQQQGHQALCAYFINFQSRQDFLERRDPQSRLGECLLNHQLGFDFLIFHHHTAPGGAYLFTGNVDFFEPRQLCEHTLKDFAADSQPFAQCFFVVAGQQRILLLEVLDFSQCPGFQRGQRRCGDQHAVNAHYFARLSQGIGQSFHSPGQPSGLADGAGQVKTIALLAGNAGGQNLLGRSIGQLTKKGEVRFSFLPEWCSIEHNSSANGYDRRKLPHDEVVLRQQQRGSAEPKLGISILSGSNLFSILQQNVGN